MVRILEQLSYRKFSRETHCLVVCKACHEYLNFHPLFSVDSNGTLGPVCIIRSKLKETDSLL